jgi:Flp pilus assembly protein TadG
MSTRAFFEKLRERCRRFGAAQGGNVVMTFALSIIPIIGFVGAAVDYSRGNSAKAAMQSAIDATALMLSKEVTKLTASQMDQKATDYFRALFNRTEVTNLVITPSYTTTSGPQVVVTAGAKVPTTFMRVFGIDSMDIGTSTTVKWGNSRLRVALVLDNTGSMASSNKLTALKTATNNLLTQLQGAVTQNGDVYVSIIPFSKDVNLDSANKSASWIDWTDYGTCNRSTYTTKSSCESAGHNWTAGNKNNWNGCVMDRGDSSAPNSGNYDTNVVAPNTSITATLYPAEQYSSCTQAAMGLNYNWSTMTTLVNNMVAAGNTNQAIGLQVGWMSLAGGGPFTVPAMDPNYKYQQVIILLTDGLNTQDRWYTSQTSIDTRQQKTCDNINAAGITLYTVQVNTSGDPTSTLLQKCAGSPGKYPDSDKFFLLTSSSQIVTTFNQIGTVLSNLRVAK